MANKGSPFERLICKELSLWWTSNLRDDVFWRSSNSGGRAKGRGRKGKKTFGSHGDIAAVDPIGSSLIDFLTIEVKRGYSKFTIADLLDRSERSAQQQWEVWYQQVIESMEQSGSYSWMIISRRDKRESIVFFTYHLLELLREEGAFRKRPSQLLLFNTSIRLVGSVSKVPERIVGTLFSDWMSGVSPTHIRSLVRKV